MRYPVSMPDIGEEERQAVARVMDSGWITQGREVEAFESELGHWLGSPHVVACSSGTAALHLALRAAGIGPGDEVIVPDLTYVATLNAILYVGATPVIVDVRAEDWNIDPMAIHRAFTPRTAAVLAVHLYGVPCPQSVRTTCMDHRIMLIEDAAEALAARFPSQAVCGTVGDMGVLSFYANKLITTGEGGAVLCKDADTAARLRLLRGQGQDLGRKFWHSVMGYNYRMTDLQAAIGRVQLLRYASLFQRRQRVFDNYTSQLRGFLSLQQPEPAAETSPWLFTGMAAHRDKLAAYMAEYGVETRPMFTPLHRLPYMDGISDSNYPTASFIADRGISLPTYPQLQAKQVDEVCGLVRMFTRRAA